MIQEPVDGFEPKESKVFLKASFEKTSLRYRRGAVQPEESLALDETKSQLNIVF